MFNALRSWVESGTAPDTLPIEFGGKDGSMQERALSVLILPRPFTGGGDSSSVESFRCVDREKMLS